MENFTYENQGVNTYLVYEIMAEDEVDSMGLGMLTNNQVPGFAATFIQQMDLKKYIKYNISAKVSVKQFFTGIVNRKRLLGVLSGIVNALISAEDYMLETDAILLDLEYIYVDVSNCGTELICFPIARERKPIDMGRFFKNIIFTTQFDQNENCDHVARIINYLNSMPVFSLVDFKKVLDELNQPKNTFSRPVPDRLVPSQPAVSPQPAVRPQLAAPSQPTVNVPAAVPSSPAAPPQLAVTPPLMAKPQETSRKSRKQKAKTEAIQKEKNTNAAGSEEEKISWLYLMQHYNKENAAKYKAQKSLQKEDKKTAAKKSKKGIVPPGMEVPMPPQGRGTMPMPSQNSPAMSVPLLKSAASQKEVTPIQPQQEVPTNVISDRYANIVPAAANFGETVVLNNGKIGETTVLDSSMQQEKLQQPYLIRIKNNERIALNKPVFRIGKEKSYVDYFIGDNTAISRSHANIISRDGEYFIMDTNSTNHTYVNGAMVQSNIEIKLTQDTKLRFANEEFEFKFY